MDFAAFDQDCVHTDGPPIPMPEKVSRDFASSLDEILPPNFHPGHYLHPDDALHVHQPNRGQLRILSLLWIPTPSELAINREHPIYFLEKPTHKRIENINKTRTGRTSTRAGCTGSGRPGPGGVFTPRRRLTQLTDGLV